ncbi:MAG: DUF2958 domain-containing protein [Deltaproteobacteria bacterium]|jgi:hypothetical protein|nr:DUF2958 domain-containing protein [Deltaproteobacteria bacterium]
MWNIPSSEQLALLPKLYETEHIPLEEKIIHMHFFLAGCDWYIAEYDGGDLFWGYVILNNDHQCAEWGYISFSELKDIKIKGGLEIDRDLYWLPQKASEIQKIRKGW